MKIKIYSTSIKYYSILNKLPNYIQPIGLGDNIFPSNWLNENSGDTIKNLNKYYGELTGFYWVWKNLLKNFGENDFIGFCHYRKLWLNYLGYKKKFSHKSIHNILLKEDDRIFLESNVIQVQPIIFRNRNLLEDFSIIHRNNILEESLEFLRDDLKINFYNHLKKNTLYPLNMFIVKKKLFNEYCSIIFPWLEKCFELCLKRDLLKDYNIRLPAFMAERFTSYWFSRFNEKKICLSYARLGNFFLSNKINNLINPLKIPFTSKIYPTIHKY